VSNRINPIHWERTGNNPVQVVDLRTLPEDVKVALMQAAIRVGINYNGGAYDSIAEDSQQDIALAEVAAQIENISTFMHEVPSLVPQA
jgi:hypothetical protein